MGIFDRLGGTSDGAITVTVTPYDAAPGAEVTVTVDVHEQLDPKARTVLAGLSCTGHYQVRVREQRSNGHTVTRTVRRSVELLRDQRALDLRHGRQAAVFTLPVSAAPSSEGAVSWEAWGRIDRARGIDVVEAVPIEVRTPLDGLGAPRPHPDSEDGLTLVGLPQGARQGGAVTGTLVVDVPEPVTARSVRVRLHRRVTWFERPVHGDGPGLGGLLLGSGSRLEEDHQVGEAELGGPDTFEPGVRRELPFRVDVPPAGATTVHPHAQVDWRVEAVLDRRLRTDRSVTAPIVVV